jgi:hypothetical protein
LVTLGSQLVGRSVKVSVIDKQTKPIQKFILLNQGAQTEAAELSNLPGEIRVAGGNEYNPAHPLIPGSDHPHRVKGSIFDLDPSTSFMVVKPGLSRVVSYLFSDRFWVRMIDDEGRPLVDLDLSHGC